MKTLITLIAMTAAPLAHATIPNDEVLKHPVLTGAFEMLQKKYGNECLAPTEQNIQWRCTGLLPSLSEPIASSSGCNFRLKITCRSDEVTFTGHSVSYSVLMPTGSAVKSYSDPSYAPDQIIFRSISTPSK